MNKIFALLICLSLSVPLRAAMTFSSASSQYVDIGNDASLNLTTEGTLTAWVNPAAFGDYMCVICKTDATTFTRNYDFDIEVTSGKVRFYTTQGAANYQGVIGNTGIPLNTWTFVAARYNGTEMQVFVNGQSDGTFSLTGAMDTTTGIAAIGIMGSSGFFYFNGDIDDARVYNRALTDTELLNLYQSSSRLVITDGLKAWHKLDDGIDGATASGATAKDSSGNGNTGTPTNSPVWRASQRISYP
jgi:hypothetical protein